MSPSVYIIILNWNTPSDTIECLNSLDKVDYDNFKVIVIDNGSTDDSVERISSAHPDIILIKNQENLGFTEGNNIGIRFALEKGADYVFILNNDTTVNRDVLKELVYAAENEDSVGILAPKTYYYDEPDIINSCGTDVNWFKLRPNLGDCGKKDNGQFESILERGLFPGSALFLTRAAMEGIGFFDKSFFIFHEDTDLCLRSKSKGYRNLLVPKAVIYHKTQRSMRKYSFLVSYYSIRNFLCVAKRYAGFKNRVFVFFGLVLFIFKNTFVVIFESKNRKEDAKGFFVGIKDYLFKKMGKYKTH